MAQSPQCAHSDWSLNTHKAQRPICATSSVYPDSLGNVVAAEFHNHLDTEIIAARDVCLIFHRLVIIPNAACISTGANVGLKAPACRKGEIFLLMLS